MVTFFPCLIYRFFCVLLKFQTYRDFPVLATIFLCFNYRVFPALTTSFFCFGYIISLFYEHLFPVLFTGFSLFFQNSMLLFFKEQGNPCYKNINMNVNIKCYIPVQNAYISLYFNEILPFKPCTLPKHVRVEILHREFPVKNLYFPCKGLQCFSSWICLKQL